jgi:translocation and assembly module TamA
LSTPRLLRARASALALGVLLLAPGARAAELRVEIEGLDDALHANARAHLSLVAYADVPDLGETTIRALHARAEPELRAALVPFGYYAPALDATLTRDGEAWVAHYRVTPGEPVLVTRADLRLEGPGAAETALRAVLDAPALTEGAVLRHDEYERTRDALLAAARAHGYRDAALVEHRIEVDPAGRAATVILHLETGRRYRFGELHIEQDVLRPEVVRRYARFSPGEPYDATKLLELQYALYDSGYFGVVETEPGEAAGDRIPVRVRAQPRARHVYRAGAGYGTGTGARVSFGYENRRLNGRGHRGALDLTLSAPRQELEAKYIVPLERPATDNRALALRAIEEELGDTQSRKAEIVARDVRQLGAWQRLLYARLANERTDVGGDRLTSTQLVPGTLWTRTRADDPILPSRGSFLSADLHGTTGALGAGTSFLRLRLDGRIVRPLGGRGRLIARAALGLSRVGEFSELPASERFFAGGEQSVRGFDLNALGPRDAAGQVVGGSRLLTASLEYEHRVRGPWRIAFFADGGNALESFGDALEYGAGVGLRYRTPLGLLRIDVAQPLTDGARGVHLHFGFGPEL